jgi:hypothetical protein
MGQYVDYVSIHGANLVVHKARVQCPGVCNIHKML